METVQIKENRINGFHRNFKNNLDAYAEILGGHKYVFKNIKEIMPMHKNDEEMLDEMFSISGRYVPSMIQNYAETASNEEIMDVRNGVVENLVLLEEQYRHLSGLSSFLEFKEKCLNCVKNYK